MKTTFIVISKLREIWKLFSILNFGSGDSKNNLPVNCTGSPLLCYYGHDQNAKIMANIKGVIGIEFDLLEKMIRNIVRQEVVAELGKGLKEINQTLTEGI